MGIERRRVIPFGIILPLWCAVLVLALFWLIPQPFLLLDGKLYDLKLSLAKPPPVHADIVHLDVDDRAIKDFGLWPWDRSVTARVVKALKEIGAKTVVLDITFFRPSNPESDRALVEAIADAGCVVVATGLTVSVDPVGKPEIEGDQARADALRERAWLPEIDRQWELMHVKRLSDKFVPMASVIGAAREVGHIKSTPDRDGVHRSVPLLIQWEDRCVPSLGLAGLAAFLGVTGSDASLAHFGEVALRHPGGIIRIPVDASGRMLINWQRDWKQAPAHNSVSYLLSNPPDPRLAQACKGKTVVVAVTSTGTTDIGSNPYSHECPLSRIHSNAMNTMLTGAFIRPVQLFPVLLPLALMVAAGFIFAAAELRVRYGLLIGVGILLGFLGMNLFVFVRWSYEVPTALPACLFGVPACAALVGRAIRMESEARRIAGAFRHYISPEMLDLIVKKGEEPDLSTRRKELTILFADIEGFSRISEEVDVEYLGAFLNDFFRAMTRAVFDHRGTVDKFLGDGLLAFFGDPVELEDHALAAVEAAEQMHREMARLNRKWSQSGIGEFEVGIHLRIGINTGMVVVGNVGSEQRMEYTVVGSAVNIAGRLQGRARADRTLIAARTFALLKGRIKCMPLETVTVKGIDKGINVCEVCAGERNDP